MRRQVFLLLASLVSAAALAVTAAAQEYSDGGHGPQGRGPAILTPVEAYGVHPPGWTAPGVCGRQRKTYVPYYAPVAPTPTLARYAPWCYFPLMPYYTPYYCGYCPHRLHTPMPPPYGADGGWGHGPMPGPAPDISAGPVLKYGAYTSVVQDDTTFWNMGGNGLVPYGAPRPPHNGPPDLVDMIQQTRGGGSGCAHSAVGPSLPPGDDSGPAITPPGEKAAEKEAPPPRKEDKKGASSEQESDSPK